MDALLKASEGILPQQRRDHAPRRDHSSVLIRGKGNKFRRCPLWSQTVNEITLLVKDRGPHRSCFS